jgi:cytochrome c-type biogenesis protein CcmH/NrfF
MSTMPAGPARREIVCKLESIVQAQVPWAYGIYEDVYRLVQKRTTSYRTAELVINKYKYVALEP